MEGVGCFRVWAAIRLGHAGRAFGSAAERSIPRLLAPATTTGSHAQGCAGTRLCPRSASLLLIPTTMPTLARPRNATRTGKWALPVCGLPGLQGPVSCASGGRLPRAHGASGSRPDPSQWPPVASRASPHFGHSRRTPSHARGGELPPCHVWAQENPKAHSSAVLPIRPPAAKSTTTPLWRARVPLR